MLQLLLSNAAAAVDAVVKEAAVVVIESATAAVDAFVKMLQLLLSNL